MFLCKRTLLRDFVERENLVAASRLRLLDPTRAVSYAGASHTILELDPCSSNSTGQQISTGVPRSGHKHRPANLLVLAILRIVHYPLANQQNNSIPICVGVIRESTGHEEKSVSIVAPVTDIEISIGNYRHDVGRRHVQRRQVGCLRCATARRYEGGVSILYNVLRDGVDLSRRHHACW